MNAFSFFLIRSGWENLPDARELAHLTLVVLIWPLCIWSSSRLLCNRISPTYTHFVLHSPHSLPPRFCRYCIVGLICLYQIFILKSSTLYLAQCNAMLDGVFITHVVAQITSVMNIWWMSVHNWSFPSPCWHYIMKNASLLLLLTIKCIYSCTSLNIP